MRTLLSAGFESLKAFCTTSFAAESFLQTSTHMALVYWMELLNGAMTERCSRSADTGGRGVACRQWDTFRADGPECLHLRAWTKCLEQCWASVVCTLTEAERTPMLHTTPTPAERSEWQSGPIKSVAFVSTRRGISRPPRGTLPQSNHTRESRASRPWTGFTTG